MWPVRGARTESYSLISLRNLSRGVRFLRRFSIIWLTCAATMSLGGCAQQPATNQRNAGTKEYFPGSVYGKPSPRVVVYGEPVPRGGGIYLIGKPYSVAGRMFFPTEKPRAAIGLASWYGEAFHGRLTANGEVYDCDAITAAHPTMPLPSYARITNLENRHSLVVRVNDRGPFHESRVLDVSRKTAELLNFHGSGTTRVKVEYIGPAGLAGSDDIKLLATLRTDSPAISSYRDLAWNFESISSASNPASNATQEKSADKDSPRTRTVGPEHPVDTSGRRTEALVSAAPLPPTRPHETIGLLPSSRSSSVAQVARATAR
jgi:rare lipoprotein A